jgi:signal transduction histidine kinase
LSNGLKFTSVNGRVDVVLESKPFVESRCEISGEIVEKIIRVSIIDTDVGISIENQSKLFGQYVQFDAAALQRGKGSGLGLWISKSMFFLFFVFVLKVNPIFFNSEIIEVHGGIIGAFSKGVGSGTDFYFDLPLYKVTKKHNF